MKKSRLQKFVWVFFALALGTTTVFAQGWRSGMRGNQLADYYANDVCLEYISDLSEEQKASIADLNETHRSEMDELRQERRSTTDLIEKNEIRGEMLQKVEAHRNTVKNLLTEKQQEQYDELQARSGNFRGRSTAPGRGNLCPRGFRGNRNGFRGKGAGYGQSRGFNRQGNQGLRGNRGRFHNQPGCIYYNN